MANEPTITLVGNLTADPELKYTPNGSAVVNFTVANTPRVFDKQTNSWTDGEALFLRCSAWNTLAENTAQSLSRGQQVIVTGKLVARSFTTKEGERRTVTELKVDEVGASLRFGTTTFHRSQPGQAQQQGSAIWGQNPPQDAPQSGGQQQAAQQAGGPWADSNPNHQTRPAF